MNAKQTQPLTQEQKVRAQKSLIWLMNQFNKERAAWINQFGSDKGFEENFTAKVRNQLSK